jgi:hypothetical protein
MDTEKVIGELSGLDLDGVAMVAAACIGLIGQEPNEEKATMAFETALRTLGATGDDAQTDLNAGGAAIYWSISHLDDGDFDFDNADDDDGEPEEPDAE